MVILFKPEGRLSTKAVCVCPMFDIKVSNFLTLVILRFGQSLPVFNRLVIFTLCVASAKVKPSRSGVKITLFQVFSHSNKALNFYK